MNGKIVFVRTAIFGFVLALLMAPVFSGVASADEDNRAVFAERERLIDLFRSRGGDAAPELVRALGHETPFIQRTAAHLLVRLGEPAISGIEKALEHPDFQVRRIAIDGLSRMNLIDEYWPTILMDTHPAIRRDVQLVLLQEHPFPKGEQLDRLIARFERAFDGAPAEKRLHIVELISEFDFSPAIRRLLIAASDDEEERIRETAFARLLEHVERDWDAAAQLLEAAQNDPSDAIRDIGLQMRWKLLQVAELRLPKDGWKYRQDPENIGRDQGWFKPEFDDAGWRGDIPIEANWQGFLDTHYHGTAWYRRTIEVPEFPKWNEAWLDFQGTDEQAWVWLNGEFVGSHEMGPRGWNVPFQLNVTEVVRPGEANHVAVMVRNTSGGGGIWAPVTLRALDTQAVQ